MSWIRVVLLNVVVFFVLLALAELGLRTAWTVKTCGSRCDYSRITHLKIRAIQDSEFIGITRFDDQVGYVATEGFDQVVKLPGWNNSRVSITKQGFRSNGADRVASQKRILVVGDSFAFGNEVSDHLTWSACLERKMRIGVDNAGMFGYGAAQSLKRAITLLPKENYSAVVLSVFVGDDFDRDRLKYRNGFAKPSVIRSNGSLDWSPVSDPKVRGTKGNPDDPKWYGPLYERSLLFASVFDRLFPLSALSRDTLTQVHPQAAETAQIIEWTIRKFASLSVDKKILLLQYSADHSNPKVLAERDLIKKVSADPKLSLTIVDTLDVLKEGDPKMLWHGHHTAHGNEVVCSLLYGRAFAQDGKK